MKRLSVYSILLSCLLLTGCGPSAALYKDKPVSAASEVTTTMATEAVGLTVQCAIEAVDWLTDACSAFKEKSHINVLVQGSGSDAGIQSTAAGTVGLAVSYRALTTDELLVLDAVKIADEAVTVVVHPDNPVTTLNPDEVNAIFSTMILNWQEVGGAPGDIKPVVLSIETPIRKWFDKCFNVLVEVDGTTESMIPDDLVTTVGTVEEMQAIVAADPLAIGFLPVTTLETGLKSVSINDQKVDPVSIRNGAYNMAHPIYVVVGKMPDASMLQLKDYLCGDAFMAKLTEIGLLTVK